MTLLVQGSRDAVGIGHQGLEALEELVVPGMGDGCGLENTRGIVYIVVVSDIGIWDTRDQ